MPTFNDRLHVGQKKCATAKVLSSSASGSGSFHMLQAANEFPDADWWRAIGRVPRERERVTSNGFIETDPAPIARPARSSSSGSVPIKS